MISRFAAAALLVVATLLAGCTSSSTGSAPSSATPSTTQVAPTTTPSIDVTPVTTGPTTAAAAKACPYAGKQFLANTVGMRLARLEVLRSGGGVVGCRVYALQHSYLATSERLPGPKQPAVEIIVQRYASATDAHNAVVLTARKGTSQQQVNLGGGTTAACYQTDFDPKDHGTDGACAADTGDRAVIVRTVVDGGSGGSFDAAKVVKQVLSSL